ncbi:thioredoxin domain-containing protein [Actinomadura sp. BRA 177]|uniref:DsbA family protein n=1 Tax=Actinomadura sp. BRA 177 TaxID=2745202 RepID=UPI0015950788|nr:thioredoxin domain-containing protein [Actinomadura sp. BRA 177]NVI87318.1 thioredoxin domain-containing protein [Actinomadura sp. BRA 177]
MPKNTSPRRNRTVIAVAGTVLAGSLGLGAVSLTTGGDGRPQAGSSSSASPSPSEDAVKMPDVARRDAADPRALGRVDAPVVLVEYADFQCPFCGKFARDVQPKLMKYVEDGTLRVEWRDFPIFGRESEAAARAGQAAARQDRFWEFHRVAYGEDRKRNSGAFATGRLVDMAREAGVPDLARFRADLDGAKAREAVDRDAEEGHGLGVPSTPAFIVNGQPVLGAQPYGAFEAAIERAAEIAKGAGQ